MRVGWKRWLCFMGLLVVAVLALAQEPTPAPKPTPLNAPPRLRVTLPWGMVVSYPVELLWAGPCISTTQFGSLLRALDAESEIEWNASTGVFHVRTKGHDISLFLRERTLVFDETTLEIEQRLIEARGQFYIALGVLDTLLSRFEHIETNISSLLNRYQPALPQSGEEVPRPPVTDPGAEGIQSVDTRALQSMLQVWSGRESIALARIETDLRLAAGNLADRKTIVIDPCLFVGDQLGRVRSDEVISAPPDLTLQIAERCRALLADSPAVQIVLTREESRRLSLAERIETVNTSGAKALVVLSLEWAEFPEAGGYRFHTVHQAVDPEGLQMGSRMYRMPEIMAQIKSAYIPYQHMSLVLARQIESELARTGNRPSEQPIRLAPHYLLKRSAMPSLTLSLGYWSNPEDRSRMQDGNYVETVAAALAQALLTYSRQLERILSEEGIAL